MTHIDLISGILRVHGQGRALRWSDVEWVSRGADLEGASGLERPAESLAECRHIMDIHGHEWAVRERAARRDRIVERVAAAASFVVSSAAVLYALAVTLAPEGRRVAAMVFLCAIALILWEPLGWALRHIGAALRRGFVRYRLKHWA